MLNKPKFMSPSINMYGNNVIDLNAETLPFSCIVDGNEPVVAWQIVVSRLSDNAVVFNTGKQNLDTPFSPINNRNQNVTFSKDLKEYLNLKKIAYYVLNRDENYHDNQEYYTYKDGVYTIYEPGDNWSEIYMTLYVREEQLAYLVLNNIDAYDSTKKYYKYNKDDDIYAEYTYVNSSQWIADRSALYIAKFKNSAEPFFWTITLWGSTGTATTGAGEVFYANTTPKISIKDAESNKDLLPDGINTLNKREAYFKAEYAQAEGIQLKRYGWRLTDSISGVTIFDTITKNQIYGLQEDISCRCTGLTNECEYVLELFIETQNGYFDVVQSAKFKVEYTVKNVEADFEISTLNESSAIMLNWGNLRTTEGIAHGEVSYVSRYPVAKENSASAVIANNSSIEFSSNANGKSLGIDENSYIVLSLQFDKSMPRLLFEATGVDEHSAVITRKLIYTRNLNNHALDYTVTKGNITVYHSIPISDITGGRCWYTATLYPLQTDSSGEYYTTLKLVESVAEGGLFPGDDENKHPVYPNDNLYPYLGKWKNLER